MVKRAETDSGFTVCFRACGDAAAPRAKQITIMKVVRGRAKGEWFLERPNGAPTKRSRTGACLGVTASLRTTKTASTANIFQWTCQVFGGGQLPTESHSC